MSLLFQISHKDEYAVQYISAKIKERIQNHSPYSNLIIFCIGTDRCTGDSLGPLVGMLLQQANPSCMQIWGTLEHPIHALNLNEAIQKLSLTQRPLVISVDACLGLPYHVGDIQVVDGPIRPGMGVRKVLPPVGDFHIKGIVNASGFVDSMVLQNTRLYTVMKMAEVIARSIQLACIR